MKYAQCFIDNVWCDSVSGKTFVTTNPATRAEICRISEGDKADVDLAVSLAFLLPQAVRSYFKSREEGEDVYLHCGVS